MCAPKAPKIEAAPVPAPPPVAPTAEAPELAYNETAPTAAARRTRIGRMSLRTDKAGTKPGVQLPRMKSTI